MVVDVYDPHADKHEVAEEYGISLITNINETYQAIVLAVSHKEFLPLDIKKLCSDENAVIFDTKSFLDRNLVDSRL